MALSAVESVASFSVVLAEVFAAVGLSTIVPAGVVTVARLAKEGSADLPALVSAISGDTTTGDHQGTAPPVPVGKPVTDLVQKMSKSVSSLDLLLPKTAHIHAEFTYQGHEKESVDITGGAEIDVVTIKAGLSALYESTSTNKITLDIDFVSVNIIL